MRPWMLVRMLLLVAVLATGLFVAGGSITGYATCDACDPETPPLIGASVALLALLLVAGELLHEQRREEGKKNELAEKRMRVV